MDRFLGGSPLSVLVRLIFISLLVGAAMAFLGLSPQNLYEAAGRFIRSITNLGFGAVREVGQWVVAGALIVVPLWLLMRLFAGRK
ncbi:Integrase [Hyphomicrobiales bacterium]|nr:Integrase [Hyphomicrobiales bacterium]CAI0345067.1 Integrase [Hyphomicrobiales bacterium]